MRSWTIATGVAAVALAAACPAVAKHDTQVDPATVPTGFLAAHSSIEGEPASADAAASIDDGVVSFIATASARPIPREVYVMNPDGTNRRQLTDDGFEKHVTAMSSDGTMIAYGCACDGLFDIYVINVDGTGKRNLTPGPLAGNFPSFSPDGTQLAFDNRGLTGEYEIYTMNLDGSGLTNVTNNPAEYDRYPSWSPDGRRLAFVRFTATSFGVDKAIYTIGVNGSGLRQVTPEFLAAGDPDWSPDGKQIVFENLSCGPCDQSDVFVVRANGTNLRQLTDNEDNAARPSWSPTGDRIIFQQWAPKSSLADIFTMDLDGGNLRNITATAHLGEGGADWGPTSRRPG